MRARQNVDAIDLEEPQTVQRFAQMGDRRLVGAPGAKTLRRERDPARFLEREGDRHARRLGADFRERQPSFFGFRPARR